MPVPLDITILNLPGAIPSLELDDAATSIHTFHYIEGDACNVHQYADGSFDLAFSNSVIEHVGPQEKQEAFAHEAVRLGKSYWVQTPSAWFPIEAHTGLPFYWFYPNQLRLTVAEIAEEVSRLVDAIHRGNASSVAPQKAELFPNGRAHVEFFFGLPKSHAAYSLPQRFPKPNDASSSSAANAPTM